MTGLALRVRDLGVAFGGQEAARVVSGLSFDVSGGEILCLLGASGAGKSVAARAVMRLEGYEGGRLTGGEITLEPGEPGASGASAQALHAASPRELQALRGTEIAMIFQEPAASLNPVRRVGAQIDEMLRRKVGLDAGAAQARGDALLARVGFEAPQDIRRAYPHQLSGGMCQRVMIAMALAGNPRVLIADEPTTALDAVAQAGILELLDGLRRDLGLAIVLITHDLDVVARMADRVVVLDRGRIVESGRVEEVLNAPASAAAGALAGTAASAGFRPQVAAGPPVLSLRDVSVRHGRGGDPVVRDVSLEVRRGEMLALVGPSGSGKTTLARAILRLLPLKAGAVALNGEDISQLSGAALRRVRAGMQMVFQDPLLSLDPRRSLGRQVADPLANFGVPVREREARVAALFESVGLDIALANRRPGDVSGGQRQRVAIARALAVDPSLIVADEALASLDPHMRGRIADLLIELQEARGLGCLFISHDIASVARIAHRIAVMHQGRIVEIGPARAVLETPAHACTAQLVAASRGAPLKSPLAPARPDARLCVVGPEHHVLTSPET